MKPSKLAFALFILLMVKFSYAQDWANLNHYKAKNAKLVSQISDEKRVIFMGNSITESWEEICPDLFSEKHYINRGISGQTTAQMLIRFRPDVINLNPAVVVILAGTNDIAGNTGPTTIDEIFGNIISMAELAKVNNIKVVLSSVLPVIDYPWKPGIEPTDKIIKLNEMIQKYTEKNGMIYLDYYSLMVDEKKGMKSSLSTDGVHPNEAGYKIMIPLAEQAIAKALKQK